MTIQKINPSFGANIRGEFVNITKGLSTQSIEKAKKELNKILPNSSDSVYFYYRYSR